MSNTTGNGKTVLLIGASRGLGLGLAGELARRGWQVIATARDPARATELAALAERTGGIQIEKLDVDDVGQLEALAGRMADRRLHMLFVNAGISGPRDQSVADLSRVDVAQVMWTNALSPVRIAGRLLPLLVPGATVAFMSSVLGSITENTSGGYELYRISKTSLNMLARGFAATSGKDKQLVVMNLHPGWVRTDMGGPQAPVSVEDSVRGLVDVLETRRNAGHAYVDYQGRELPW
jgi:NAD(P)-dependent dehydrogenase (short-subunit alcohol dehydrogenase family)